MDNLLVSASINSGDAGCAAYSCLGTSTAHMSKHVHVAGNLDSAEASSRPFAIAS